MQSTVRILCVDDDANLLSVMADLLRHKGYEVLAVSSGQAAVDQTCREFDLMIVDYNLPDFNGDVVAEHWKCEQPEVPILLLSGCPNLPPHALDHVNGYLRKGDGTDQLFTAVSDLTHARQRMSLEAHELWNARKMDADSERMRPYIYDQAS